jgi:hypothetical protein
MKKAAVTGKAAESSSMNCSGVPTSVMIKRQEVSRRIILKDSNIIE